MANSDMSNQGGLQGSSYIYNLGASPNTRAAMSQKVRILSSAYGQGSAAQIGVLGNFSVSMSRSSEPLRGIGFGDKIAELVPAVQDPITVSLERTLLYLSNLWQALGYAGGASGPVRALSHMCWPFDMEQQVVFSSIADQEVVAAAGERTGFSAGIQNISFPEVTQFSGNGGGSHSAMITMYEGCWLQDTSFAFSKDAQVISESGSAMCRDIHDFASTYGEFMETGNNPYNGEQGSIQFADDVAARRTATRTIDRPIGT